MSFVIAVPEFLSAAATDLANLGSTISAANAAASIPTTGVLAAGADDVSAAIAALFGAHAQAYQTISAQAATFHAQFVQTLSAGAGAYANAEAANVQQSLLNAINAPTQALLGRPLIGDGATGATGLPELGAWLAGSARFTVVTHAALARRDGQGVDPGGTRRAGRAEPPGPTVAE